ncbi:MAG: alpha-isopropylmalate synthase regulatory domain-containing protein [Patescibacteria group bacterium]|nr:alpha-isopropylmalate synthase regulatory domain-containing protein [Patescibacteria group bacterium]
MEKEKKYELAYLHVACGSGIKPAATVAIKVRGKEISVANNGAGPIDAAFKAVALITETKSHLTHLHINSINGGTDALGEATVFLEEGCYAVAGHGADLDIVTASVMAYLNALNQIEEFKKSKD